MALAVAVTAARLGATIANYTEVQGLLYQETEDGKRVVSGATVLDTVSGTHCVVFLLSLTCHLW